MPRKLRIRVRRPAPGTVIATVALVVATSGVAIAGHQGGDVQSLTGCLKNGAISRIAVGDAPARECKGKEQEVHLSAGDITSVDAGTGLSGGSANGSAPVEIAPGYRLPQDCADGQVPKATAAGTYACEADDDTTYTPGAGLALTGTTFGTDFDTVQRRVTANCEENQAIQRIFDDGTVDCEEDSAGTGVERHVSEHFEVASGTHTTRTLSCPSGLKVLGGGWDIDDDDFNDATVAQSYPPDEDTWAVTFRNVGPFDSSGFRIYVLCGKA